MSTRLPPSKRLYECSVEAEGPDGYRAGRYFPVKLGDVFKDGRYRIVHKLGWGGFATVWLARDMQENSNVALKVINVNTNIPELQVLHHLRTSCIALDNASHPGRNAVLRLLDDLNLGTSHKVLVLDVMGADVQSRADAQPGHRLARKTARSAAHQVVLGSDYLWNCGVAHGDLYGRNILFNAPAIAALPEDQVMSCLGTPKTGLVRRRDDGLLEPSVPSYLVSPASIHGGDTEIKIVDLGNAFFHNGPPQQLSTPWHVRAPEAIYGQPLSKCVDMWSMGCLLFELVTGRTFMDAFLADRASVITGLKAILGPPPAKWLITMHGMSS